jgi:hypothetical protein
MRQDIEFNHAFISEEARKRKNMRDRNKSIIAKVKEVCQKFGGCAEIGAGYVIVDTKLYTVTQKLPDSFKSE